jgi:hypothetical protein
MAMGNSLFPVVSNIFLEHFEEITLDTAEHKLVRRQHFSGLVTWTNTVAAISSPLQQPDTYHQFHYVN